MINSKLAAARWAGPVQRPAFMYSDLGRATAMAVVSFIILLAFTLVYLWLQARVREG